MVADTGIGIVADYERGGALVHAQKCVGRTGNYQSATKPATFSPSSEIHVKIRQPFVSVAPFVTVLNKAVSPLLFTAACAKLSPKTERKGVMRDGPPLEEQSDLG